MSKYIEADDLISRIRATIAINVGVGDERNTLKNGLMLCEKLVELKCRGIDIDLADDGTLSVEVDDATKVKRVLVEDGKNGNLYYADRPSEIIYGNEHNCMMTIFGECSYAETGCGDCAVVEKVRKALSADRPQGEWIDKSNGIEGAWNYCSVCGEQAIDLYDFCPNCGAKMKGADDE